MLSLLIWLLVMVVIMAIVWGILNLLPIGQPFRNIILAIFGLICLIVLLGALFGGIALPHPIYLR